MANDNNKINDLVGTSEDDPTSELESMTDERRSASGYYDEAESDEDTFDFDRLENAGELTGKSVAALKSDIKARNESISRLQFDIEQLRSRWTGLEKEIRAREDLTDRLNDQLSETQAKLARTEELLGQRDKDYDELQASVKEKQHLLASVEEETQNISRTVETGKSVISELQTTVESQHSTIKKLHKDNLALENENAASGTRAKKLQNELDDLRRRGSVESKEDRDKALEVKALENELRNANQKVNVALKKIDSLNAAIKKSESLQATDLQDRLAKQEGIIAENTQDLADLRVQISRTEKYADGLRGQLQQLSSVQGDSSRNRHQLSTALNGAMDQIRDLTEQLDSDRLGSARLREEMEASKTEFEREIRQVRFELGGAQETLAGHETVNEQLASDLIDNQGYRQALESQLEVSGKESKRKIRDLERALKNSDQARDDAEHKLENKDNAIAALLSELASRSRTIESIGEIENVIHEIDGRMSDRIDEKAAGEKDRMARLLIGNVDGQELQFPLFKDRLTIGRTTHNDIQLKAQFISRRHALIVTENEVTKIIDWGSKNGVYVNDSRVAEQVLGNGDVVAIGTAEFRYEERQKR